MRGRSKPESRWEIGNILALAFTILSIVSVTYIATASANYLNFYPSLGEINQQVSTVAYHHDTVSNQTSIVSHVIVDNPSDYSGFTLRIIELKIFFNATSINQTLFAIYPLSDSQALVIPMPPHSRVSSDLVLILQPDQTAKLDGFRAAYSPIVAHCILQVSIEDFLKPVTSYLIKNTEQNVQLA